jgi:hypothetical protein
VRKSKKITLNAQKNDNFYYKDNKINDETENIIINQDLQTTTKISTSNKCKCTKNCKCKRCICKKEGICDSNQCKACNNQ